MRRTKLIAALAATTALILGTAACTSATTPPSPTSSSLEHVHAFAHLDTSPVVLVGTHTGLWKFSLTALEQENPNPASLLPVGQDRFDVMGLSTTPEGGLIASGHPSADAPLSTPPNRGFLHSQDAGTSWDTIALEGEADFHDLTTAADSVLGLNSATGTLLRSDDNGVTWTTQSATTALSIAVDPANPDTLWAAGPDGLQSSTDRGATFTTTQQGPPLVFVAGAAGAITGTAATGDVWTLTPGTANWSRTGQLQGQPQAFDVIDIAGQPVHLAVDDRAIVASHDNGTTWTVVPLTL